ncbi:MAG TPA: CBS domain-containing protein [Methylomirabilota bacterium]|nr:CBS domain-containing protein [Methylomirabilota bacterium]
MNEDSYFKEILGLSIAANMMPAPPTVSPHEPASTVMELMTRRNIGFVVVVENNKPVGVVTDKDMLQRALKFGKNLELTPVKDIMSKPPVTIEAEQTVAHSLELLHRHNVRRLIVTRQDAVVGVTTAKILLEFVQSQYERNRHESVESMTGNEARKIRVAYVSTYPPRECGIASYTKDLVEAVSWFCSGAVTTPVIVAMNDRGAHYDYEIRVRAQIDVDDIRSYEKVAQYLNASDIDVVNLQHEYGIYGGEWGDYVTEFLQMIEKPVVTTLHSLPEEPVPDARRVLERILEHSELVIVMAKVGIRILERQYGRSADRTRYIPHGCPNVPYIETAMMKESLGLQNRVVLSTFGLLSSGKGIEYVIQALPQIQRERPEILYLIIGETHPEVRKREGETYRQFLFNLVESLGMEENVRFVNRFLTLNELINYLQATDIYVIPYPNREQISSGTLSYALSTGRAIITTPFLQAEEVISNGAALECKFSNPDSITECVNMLLKDDRNAQRLRRMAYEYSRATIWPNVAMRYVNAFYHTLGL